jgi:hypothetical protein
MPPTRTALAVADDDGWRRILLAIGMAGAAGTVYKLIRGYKFGPMEAISALALIIGLLGGDR